MKVILVYLRTDDLSLSVKYHTNDGVLRENIIIRECDLPYEDMELRAVRAVLLLLGVDGFENHRLLHRPGINTGKTSYYIYLDDDDVDHVQSGIVTDEEIAKVFASDAARNT